MEPEAYAGFTERLRARLEADDRVLGLVALGSMAAVDYAPDEWSDHDFFVIARAGEQEGLRTDLSWLPDAGRLAFSFRETEHGVKAVYGDGHLVELAVFDEAELGLARVNRYRVLLDRCGLERRMGEVRAATERATGSERRADAWLAGQLLTNLLVGVGRYRRGERLSGHLFVKQHALGHLLALLARHVPAARADLLDDLDPARRFDLVYPLLGAELDALLVAEVPTAAARMLDLARRELSAAAGLSDAALDAVGRVVRAAHQ